MLMLTESLFGPREVWGKFTTKKNQTKKTPFAPRPDGGVITHAS